jgi:hypothetical protein
MVDSCWCTCALSARISLSLAASWARRAAMMLVSRPFGAGSVGWVSAVLIDDGDEVAVFMDGFALHAGAGGDGRDVDGGLGSARLAMCTAFVFGDGVAVAGQALQGFVCWWWRSGAHWGVSAGGIGREVPTR